MQKILITGAASGIGLALSREYASMGHFVYAGVRNIEAVPTELSDHKNIMLLQLDVTSLDDINSAVLKMEQSNGSPDILINNAGINLPGTVEECSQENLSKIFDVNLFGAINVTKAILPSMREKGNGTIVMISSLSAAIGLPMDGPYAASKAALNNMAESLYHELKPLGIKVCIAIIGSVATNLNFKVKYGLNIDDYKIANDLFLKKVKNAEPGSDTQNVAQELIAKLQGSNRSLFCPIGEKTINQYKTIKFLHERDREELAYEVSGLNNWRDKINQNRK